MGYVIEVGVVSPGMRDRGSRANKNCEPRSEQTNKSAKRTGTGRERDMVG
jgi:hypothetical protein